MIHGLVTICRQSAAFYLRLAANTTHAAVRNLATQCALQRQQCAAALEALVGSTPAEAGPTPIEIGEPGVSVAEACVAHETTVVKRFESIVDAVQESAVLKSVLKQFERTIDLHDWVLQSFSDDHAAAA